MLFAAGGLDDMKSALTSVEMLQCPWDTEEPGNPQWQFVAPMHHARFGHALAYFGGKLIAAGGKVQDSVECFTLPTGELPEGQWVMIRPMSHANPLEGILPFGEDLLFVGKCTIYFLLSKHSFFYFEEVTQREYWPSNLLYMPHAIVMLHVTEVGTAIVLDMFLH